MSEKRELYRFRLPGGGYHVIAQSGSGAEARLWWRSERPANILLETPPEYGGWNEYEDLHQDEVLELLCLAEVVRDQKEERKKLEAQLALFRASYDQAEQENRRLREELERLKKGEPAPKERRRAEPAEGAEIPAELREWRDRDKKPFSTAWAEYLEWRRKWRNYPTNKAWAERQLAAMAEWGPEEAVEALEESMRQGWQGIFRPKGKQREPEPVSRPAAPYHRSFGSTDQAHGGAFGKPSGGAR